MNTWRRRDLLKGVRLLPALTVGALIAGNKRLFAATCPPTEIRQTQTGSLMDNCTNEMVDYNIEVHSVIHLCGNPDGSLSGNVHISTHGAAVGQTTGNRYIMNEHTIDKTFIASTGCPFTDSQTYQQVLVSKGPAPNLKVNTTFTTTTDASCNLQFSSTFASVCKG